MSTAKLDHIGYWSEVKLEIVRDYARAYSQILSAQKNPSLYHIYIDGFAGRGLHLSKRTGEYVAGSPLNALNISPPFREFHFVDLDGSKVKQLRDVASERRDVYVHEKDCNEVLLKEVFPRVCYENYRRGLCLLDPYGLHLNWEVIHSAGQMKSLEIFLNFPVMDMNMNVLWHDRSRVDTRQAERMDAYWGDRSWEKAAYTKRRDLFDELEEKADNEDVAEAFRARLKDVAGFAHVLPPMPMRNTRGATVYYLFFASHKPAAEKIVSDIFTRYKKRGLKHG